jgi:hypothetical protein
MRSFREEEQGPLERSATPDPAMLMPPEEKQVMDKARQAEIAAYLQNAMGQQTSRASDTLFNAFTGERPATPTTQAQPMKSPYDFEMIKQKLEGEKMDRELQKGQIEKYAAEAYAKRNGKGMGADWVDSGFRTKESAPGLDINGEHNPPRAIYRNKVTGELKPEDLPSGAYEKADMNTAIMALLEEGRNTRAAMPKQPEGPLSDARKEELRIQNENRLREIEAQGRANQTRDAAKPVKPTPTPKTDMTMDQRIEALKTADRSKYEGAVMGRKAAEDMEAALAAGDKTISLIGDNHFTMAQRMWGEAIGRMQSGGVINNEEAANFRKMGPGPLDTDPKIVKDKIAAMKDEMDSRIKNLGFDPAEAMKRRRGVSGPSNPDTKIIAGETWNKDKTTGKWKKAK